MKLGSRFWIAAGVLLLLAIAFIFAAYHFDWTGTGFENKTLWDWLQLLIIPLALAIIALLFNLASTRTEQKIANQRYEQDQKIAAQRYEQDQTIAAQRYEQDQKIALDKQREDLLQHYLDCMADLLLEKKLHSPDSSAEARNLARVRTITILFQLDARRIGYVFAFLREAGLMSTTSKSIVSLRKANLNKINFSQTVIPDADLGEAILIEAILSNALLIRANLSGAFLNFANLSGAFLSNANLSKADLSGADLSGTDLSGADLSGTSLWRANLTGARMQGVKGLTAEQLKQYEARGAII